MFYVPFRCSETEIIYCFQRCCRDHRNKLDLDSLLISPIQRIPRYELMVKQLLKHTPAEHYDHECLLRAQRHIHSLALGINQHKEATEQQEQRLREIEAIVDGLDDVGQDFLPRNGSFSWFPREEISFDTTWSR